MRYLFLSLVGIVLRCPRTCPISNIRGVRMMREPLWTGKRFRNIPGPWQCRSLPPSIQRLLYQWRIVGMCALLLSMLCPPRRFDQLLKSRLATNTTTSCCHSKSPNHTTYFLVFPAVSFSLGEVKTRNLRVGVRQQCTHIGARIKRNAQRYRLWARVPYLSVLFHRLGTWQKEDSTNVMPALGRSPHLLHCPTIIPRQTAAFFATNALPDLSPMTPNTAITSC